MAKRLGDWGIFKRGWWAKQLGGGRLVSLILLGGLIALRIDDPALLEVMRAKTFEFREFSH